MENLPDPQTPDEKRKDTSLPGREEEVIVNTEEQQRVTNVDETNPPEENASQESTLPDRNSVENKEKTFKEGMEDNSDTEALK